MTPGTPKNRLLELYVMPVSVAHPIFLAKKTEGLREQLNDPPNFDRTLAFIFADKAVDREGGFSIVAEQIYYPVDGDLDQAVEQLILGVSD